VRRIWTTTELNKYVEFPYLLQIAKLERYRQDVKTGKSSSETVYLITSRGPKRLDARGLLETQRRYWSIENRLHYVRDWNFDEDRSQIRTGRTPWVMATLRNTAVSLLRLHQHHAIATALRELAAQPHRALTLMGL